MSITATALKLKGATRHQILTEVEQLLKQAVLEQVSRFLTEILEAEVSLQLGRSYRHERTVAANPKVSDWQCRQCGCSDANQFVRDGHYKRTLETSFGHLPALRVPMLECLRCGHDVACQWQILPKYARFWFDLAHQAAYGSSMGQSLRQLAEEWSATLGGSVSLRTINARITAVEAAVTSWKAQPISRVPPVLQLDGIWFCEQVATEQVRLDKRGRKRVVQTGQRRVILIALGLWEDGRHQILDWEIADSESSENWQKLVQRLWERGVRAERGLKVLVRDGGPGLAAAYDLIYSGEVLEQLCIFHKLRAASRHFKRGVSAKTDALKHAAQALQRQQILEEGCQIYGAVSKEAAQKRFEEWKERWVRFEPKVVASLEANFELSLSYYELGELSQKLIRTTSILERVNRELRRKLRQAGTLGANCGRDATIHLQVERLNARWAGVNWAGAIPAQYLAMTNFYP